MNLQPGNDYTQNRVSRLLILFIALVAVVATLNAAVGAAHASTTPARAPDPPGPFRIEAWMPTSWDAKLARASFDANLDKLHTISPFWYTFTPDGKLVPFRGARDTGLILQAQDAGVLVVPTITNRFNQQLVHTILNDDARARALRDALLAEVLTQGLDGIDIDFENIAAEDRRRFSDWIAALGHDLHAQQRLLTVTVQPKTYPATDHNGAGALDYRALGEVADELRIMTYGWCWAGGCMGGNPPPGPIAPLHWQQRVIRYAKGRVSANKIVLGIHLYGYDWPIDVPEAATTPTSALQRCWRIGFPHHRLSGPPTMRQWALACFGRCGRESAPTVPPLLAYTSQLAISPLATGVASQTIIAGKALVWRQAQTLLQTHEAQLRWWEPEGRGLVGEPWFTYADGSQGVTFANADSVQLRINLARKEGLRGVIFWRLGGEDPAIWARLP